jgi:hypothetical protein
MLLADSAVMAYRRAELTAPGTMAHALPFQCSISAALPPDPTAQASVAEMAATERRPARDGSPAGDGTRAQEVPVKCSIRLVRVPVAGLESEPTAHPPAAPLNATPASCACSPAGIGAVGTIDHRVPSKCSAVTVAVNTHIRDPAATPPVLPADQLSRIPHRASAAQTARV